MNRPQPDNRESVTDSRPAELGSIQFLLRRMSRPQFYLNVVKTLLDIPKWKHFYEAADALAEERGSNFTVVQIGANDGRHADPVNRVITHHACRALLVEPVEQYFKALTQTYAGHPGVQFANVAVDQQNGQAKMFRVSAPEGAKTRMQGWSSFHREVIETGKWIVGDTTKLVTEVQVPTVKLGTLLLDHSIESVDLFVSDTEGHDGVVVNQLLDLEMFPPIVLYEHAHLSTADNTHLNGRLSEIGYEVQKLKRDTVAYL